MSRMEYLEQNNEQLNAGNPRRTHCLFQNIRSKVEFHGRPPHGWGLFAIDNGGFLEPLILGSLQMPMSALGKLHRGVAIVSGGPLCAVSADGACPSACAAIEWW